MVTEQNNPVVGGDDGDGPDPDIQMSEEKAPNADLHAYNKRLKAENKGYRGRIMDADLQAIGLNSQEGLGKAIVQTYKGELNEGAVATYARDEYNHDSAIPTQVPEAVQQGERMEMLGGASEPVVPVEPAAPGQDKIDMIDSNDPEATRQDAIASIQAKAAQFREAFPQ